MMLSGHKLLYSFFILSGMAHALVFIDQGTDSGTRQHQPWQRPLVIQLATKSEKQGVRSSNPDKQTQPGQTSTRSSSNRSKRQKQSAPRHVARRQNAAASMQRKPVKRLPATRHKRRVNRSKPALAANTRTPHRNSRPPRYGLGSLHNPSPRYPYRAIKHGMEGRVLVRAFVKSNGYVHTTRVERSSGYPVLDQAASQTVARWRFLPALDKGLPAAGEVTVPIRFRLKDNRHTEDR